MKMTSCRQIVFTLVLAYAVAPISPFCRTLFAESVIRITGDKSTEVSDVPKIPTSSVVRSSERNTIRIIGDKQEYDSSKNKVMPQQKAIDAAVQVPNAAAEKAEQERQAQLKEAREKAELEEKLLADRKAAEKAEQERQAQLKEAREKAELEEKLLADRKAAAEKAEQERQAQLKEAREKAELEEKLLADRKAAAEKTEQERQAQLKAIRESAAAEMALQAAVLLEQKQVAERKTNGLQKGNKRSALERNEIVNNNDDEDKLISARKALLRKHLTDTSVAKKSISSGSDTEGVSVTRIVQDNVGGETSSPPASIWELYLAAKNNDPTLGRSEARVTGSKADSDLVFSTLMPRLDSRVGVNQISQTLLNYNTTSNVSNNYTAFNYGVTAHQTLLNVSSLFSLSAAAAALKVEEAGVASARQNLIVKCTDAYFALLKAQTDKQIALGEINRLKQVFEQAQAFLEAGTGDIIAVYEAQSRLDGASADLSKSESSLRLAEQKLSSLTGKSVSSVVNYLPQQPAAPEPDSLDWWVATMEKEHPQIRQAREGLNQTAEQRKSVKSEYLPVLQASGGYDVNRGTAALPNSEVRQWSVGVALTLPIYSGGETLAKVRRATATEEERRHMLNESMDQYRENVKQAFFNLNYNVSLIKALDQKQISTEIQLAAVKKGRKIGTRNAIDVLNAEQAYSMALRDHRHAKYDNIIKFIQLKSAAGILSEADLSGLSQYEAPNPDVGLNIIISKVTSN